MAISLQQEGYCEANYRRTQRLRKESNKIAPDQKYNSVSVIRRKFGPPLFYKSLAYLAADFVRPRPNFFCESFASEFHMHRVHAPVITTFEV
jgi:hypothetical protein